MRKGKTYQRPVDAEGRAVCELCGTRVELRTDGRCLLGHWVTSAAAVATARAAATGAPGDEEAAQLHVVHELPDAPALAEDFAPSGGHAPEHTRLERETWPVHEPLDDLDELDEPGHAGGAGTASPAPLFDDLDKLHAAHKPQRPVVRGEWLPPEDDVDIFDRPILREGKQLVDAGAPTNRFPS